MTVIGRESAGVAHGGRARHDIIGRLLDRPGGQAAHWRALHAQERAIRLPFALSATAFCAQCAVDLGAGVPRPLVLMAAAGSTPSSSVYVYLCICELCLAV